MHFALALLIAGSHIATPEQIEARLVSASADGGAALATVTGYAQPHTDMDVRALAGRLRDEELKDLAARAEMLQADPVAGASAGLVVLASVGAVLIVLLIVGAIACSDDASC